MQYKIPVQIENEDNIIFGLSLRQLIIIMIGGGLAYMTFNSLSESIGAEIALLIAIPIVGIFLAVAVIKVSEMTFINLVLSFIRYQMTYPERMWTKGVDSYSSLDIGYINQNTKVDKKVDFGDKMDKMKKIDEKLEKI